MSIYYVTQAAAGGGAGTIGDPFTLAEARAAVVAGDKVFIKADADYTTQDGASGSILHLSVTGTYANPITWEGYTTTPGDGGQVTFDTGTAGLTRGVGASAGTVSHQILKNIICLGGTQGFNGSNGACDSWVLINCKAENTSLAGYWLDTNLKFLRSVSKNCAQAYRLGSINMLIGCEAYGASSTYVFYGSGELLLYGCIGYNNAGLNYVNANPPRVFNCTFDGENHATSVGVYANTTQEQEVAINNVIYDMQTGISAVNASATTVDSDSMSFFDWSLFYSNVANVSGTSLNGYGDVSGTGDPFTDEAADDYTLASGSEAIDAGIDAATVGPYV